MKNSYWRRRTVLPLAGVMAVLIYHIGLLAPDPMDPHSAQALIALTTGEMAPAGEFPKGKILQPTPGLATKGVQSGSNAIGVKSRVGSGFATTPAIKSTRKGATTNSAAPRQDSTALTFIDNNKDKFLKTFKVDCEKTIIPTDLVAKDKQCSCIPDKLVGRRLPGTYVPTWQELETAHPDMEEGGHWRPSSCVPRQRACFFLPYRDRQEHLLRWLKVMLPFMKKQNSDFRIFVTEQSQGNWFNRGMLINAGVAHVEKEGIHCDCIIIHDVDHVPEDDRNIYFCQDNPIHLGVANDRHKYKLPYPSFVGGAIAVTHDVYKRINGFSNVYFGWGSEDDDIGQRFRSSGFRMKRYPTYIAYYTMFKHERAVMNAGRGKLMKAWRIRWKNDGLVDVTKLCSIAKVEKNKLVTFLHVHIDETPRSNSTGRV